MTGNNMFAYCGNNPISREDQSGQFWIQVGLGLLGQYTSDILDNFVEGKTGIELFMPKSSLADYTIAAVTAIIPGNAVTSALTRSIVTEGITWVDNIITGNSTKNNLTDSMKKIAVNTVVDVAFGTVVDSMDLSASRDNLSSFTKSTGAGGVIGNLNKTYAKVLHRARVRQTAGEIWSLGVNYISTYVNRKMCKILGIT